MVRDRERERERERAYRVEDCERECERREVYNPCLIVEVNYFKFCTLKYISNFLW